MISRLNLVLAFLLALAGLALLVFATSSLDLKTRPVGSVAEPADRDGLSDAMTFSPPAGSKR